MNVVAGFGGGEEFAIRRANDTSGVARKVASEIGAVRLAQAADMRRGDVVGLPVRPMQLEQFQRGAAGRQHNDKDSEAQQKKRQRVVHSCVDRRMPMYYICRMKKAVKRPPADVRELLSVRIPGDLRRRIHEACEAGSYKITVTTLVERGIELAIKEWRAEIAARDSK